MKDNISPEIKKFIFKPTATSDWVNELTIQAIDISSAIQAFKEIIIGRGSKISEKWPSSTLKLKENLWCYSVTSFTEDPDDLDNPWESDIQFDIYEYNLNEK